jgi:hypothetical protein
MMSKALNTASCSLAAVTSTPAEPSLTAPPRRCARAGLLDQQRYRHGRGSSLTCREERGKSEGRFQSRPRRRRCHGAARSTSPYQCLVATPITILISFTLLFFIFHVPFHSAKSPMPTGKAEQVLTPNTHSPCGPDSTVRARRGNSRVGLMPRHRLRSFPRRPGR